MFSYSEGVHDAYMSTTVGDTLYVLLVQAPDWEEPLVCLAYPRHTYASKSIYLPGNSWLPIAGHPLGSHNRYGYSYGENMILSVNQHYSNNVAASLNGFVSTAELLTTKPLRPTTVDRLHKSMVRKKSKMS